MNSILNYKKTPIKIASLFCIIVNVGLLTSILVFYQWPSLSSSVHVLLSKCDKYCLYNNWNKDPSTLPVDKLLLNLTFSIHHIYHHNGIAYDYYSKNDIGQTKPSCQWKDWPLPSETNPNLKSNNREMSPFLMTKLPFVNAIYVLTDRRLIERHNNLKKAFHQQGILTESIEWIMQWNQTTCNSNATRSYVYQRLNLNDKPLNDHQQKRCALAMKHVDVWHQISEKQMQLALILEDDAIFVPFFKEKFTRMIYAAIDQKILHLNQACVKSKEKPIANKEWINQNPMIVIGTCFNFHGESFQKHSSHAPPIFTTHKMDSSRCTHAYLLTACSAQALIEQISAQKNDFWPSDFLQNYLFRLSPTLQAFWMDPPLAYQGNQVTDLDKLPSFSSQTYISLD